MKEALSSFFISRKGNIMSQKIINFAILFNELQTQEFSF